MGTLKLSFLPSASCLWEKHPHELIVSVPAAQSFYDQRFLRTYITSFSLFSHHSKPFLCFTQVSAFTYSKRGDISLKLAGRGGDKTDKTIRLKCKHGLPNHSIAHTLPIPVRNKSCGILRVLPKPKRETSFNKMATSKLTTQYTCRLYPNKME